MIKITTSQTTRNKSKKKWPNIWKDFIKTTVQSGLLCNSRKNEKMERIICYAWKLCFKYSSNPSQPVSYCSKMKQGKCISSVPTTPTPKPPTPKPAKRKYLTLDIANQMRNLSQSKLKKLAGKCSGWRWGWSKFYQKCSECDKNGKCREVRKYCKEIKWVKGKSVCVRPA